MSFSSSVSVGRGFGEEAWEGEGLVRGVRFLRSAIGTGEGGLGLGVGFQPATFVERVVAGAVGKVGGGRGCRGSSL